MAITHNNYRNKNKMNDFVSCDINRLFQDEENTVSVLEQIIGCMSCGIIVAKIDGSFSISNSIAKKILGKPDSEDIDDWPSYYGCYESEESMRLLTTDELPLVMAIQGKNVNNLEIFIKNEVQTGAWILCKASPIITDGKIVGGVIVFQDTSETHLLAKSIKLLEKSYNETLNKLVA